MAQNARDAHMHDQYTAGMRQFAAGLATMYAELVVQGVPPDHAAEVIARMAATQLAAALDPKRREDG